MAKVSVRLDNKKTEDILGLVGSPSIVLSELIKNSLDSNSKSVGIFIDTRKREVTVSDKGDGLNEEDIKKLGLIGKSDKKEIGKECRENGEYYGGSKGLGLLSAFSLSNYIEIRTRKGDESYLIKWEKSRGEFSYEGIEQLSDCGTEITMKNISKDNINILTDEDEYKKLRHVTIYHFKNKGSTCKNINFYIDKKLKDKFSCCDIKDIDDIFIYKIDFRYYSKSNKLTYKFDRADVNRVVNNRIINKGNNPIDRLTKNITLDLNNNVKINDIIKNTYKLTKVSKERNFKYLNTSLEDFYGSLYVTAGQHGNIKKLIEQFGYGVKIFINNFAIYGYLDNENDWLGFGELSQLGKFTTLKPHNVFGYVCFDKFNEKKSSLEIANERTNFIEKAPYKKFIEIMKNIVVKITFEIDVAYRNKNIDSENYFKDLEDAEDSNDNSINENEDLDGENELSHGNSSIDNTGEGKGEGDKDSDLDIENESRHGNSNIDNTGEGKGEGDKDSDLDIENEPRHGNSNTDDTGEGKEKGNKENNHKIGLKNKPKFNFFSTSNVIKTNQKINIGCNEIIKQLKKLEYKNFYLIYVMAFRSILEDGCKRYLNDRSIPLCSDMGKNVRNMADDMINIVSKDSSYIENDDKIYIQNILGGFHAYKNTLETIGCQFYSNGSQGIKAVELNSFVHSPRWMEEQEAEYIANDVILTLLVVSQEILKRIKK